MGGRASNGFEPAARHLAILGDAVDTEKSAVQAVGDQRNRAAAHERIEHQAAVGAAGQKARFDKRRRKHRKVGLAEF